MSVRGLGFWGTTIAGVISALAATAVMWLLGFLPQVWAWFAGVAAMFWGWLTVAISVPVSLLLAAGVLLLLIGRALSSKEARTPTSQTSVMKSESTIQLNPLDLAVIRLLANADGDWLDLDGIARGIESPRLLTERVLERLMGLNFLIDRHNVIYGTSFRLSSQGRDYALDHNLFG